MWKERHSLLEPDVRFSFFTKIAPDGSPAGGLTIEDLYDMVAPLELHASVPDEIRTQFDLARSAFVYSWFAYEMATLAEQQSYACVEAAIKHRSAAEGTGLSDKTGLRQSIDHAIAEGWLDRRQFEYGGQGSPPICALDFLVTMRNKLMHGEAHLAPDGSLRMMKISHEIISTLIAVQPRA